MKNFNEIFPAELVSDILSRLPVEAVLDCKLVCTTWKNLIQQPQFPKLHLNHIKRPDSGKLRYVFLDTEDDCAAQLVHFEYNVNEEDWWTNFICRKFNTGTLELNDYVLIGSFNGLVCVYGTQKKYDAMIINPVTKEYAVLPRFKTKRGKLSIRYEHLACGFGYLAETNEYKVVRIYRRQKAQEPNVVEVEVYTVGSGEGWRHVGKFDLGFKFVINGVDQDGYKQLQGVFWNGCLCWRNLDWRNLEGGMVMLFDLADEEFREPIPPPRVLTDDDVDEDGNMVLGVSNAGILYYTVWLLVQQQQEDEDEDEENHVNEVWLLMRKDDDHVMGGQEEKQPWVWSKPISLEQTEPFAFKEQYFVLRYEQGNIKEFKRYVNSTCAWEDIEECSEISRRVFAHHHTLISLKELGEADAKIMNRCPMEDYRRMCDFDRIRFD